MTRGGSDSVRLSARDWLGLSGILFALITAIATTYAQMDRSLVELRVQSNYQAEQLSALRSDIERLESVLLRGSIP